MKLLFSDNTIWGLVNFRQSVFGYFHRQGHDIVLVAPDDRHTQMKAHVPEFVKFVPVKLERTGHNPFADLSYLFSLYRIYRRERPDWIFHYTVKPNIYGTLAARCAHIRSVALVAGLGYAFTKKGWMEHAVLLLYRFALRYANKVFVLNRENLDVLTQYKVAPAKKMIWLKGGEGIDTNVVHEGKPIRPGVRTTFLMVGRALYDKGYAEFVAAARSLKSQGADADFCLLGPVDETYPFAVTRTTLDEDVASGTIRYLGFSTTPLEIMGREGTVIVLPSYHEGMSRSLMEACALGKPIITTDIPGCREMVEEGVNGYLVPPKNATALAGAMKKYLRLTPEQQLQIGQDSRRIAIERFDVRHVIEKYEEVIHLRQP